MKVLEVIKKNKKQYLITLLTCLIVVFSISKGSTIEKRPLAKREPSRRQLEVNNESKQEANLQESQTTSKSSDEDKEDTLAYKDGSYTGQAQGYKGEVKVQVSVKNGKIDKINIVEHSDDEDYFNKAKSLTDEVIKAQDTNVDAVSGATFSSNGILDAIQNALESGV